MTSDDTLCFKITPVTNTTPSDEAGDLGGGGGKRLIKDLKGKANSLSGDTRKGNNA